MANPVRSWDTPALAPMPKANPREVRLTQLVNRHIGFVERVLRNMGVPEADIDDAVQRTFIVVANRLDDIIPAAEKSFLFRSAKHVASHVRRSLARRRLEPIDDHVLSHDESPERAVSQKRAREMLDDILSRLPDDLRFVFTLFEFEDLTVPEIAQMLEIPVGTAASRLRRAREHFKVELRRIEALSLRSSPTASPAFARRVASGHVLESEPAAPEGPQSVGAQSVGAQSVGAQSIGAQSIGAQSVGVSAALGGPLGRKVGS